jgi:hypothetical protein
VGGGGGAVVVVGGGGGAVVVVVVDVVVVVVVASVVVVGGSVVVDRSVVGGESLVVVRSVAVSSESSVEPPAIAAVMISTITAVTTQACQGAAFTRVGPTVAPLRTEAPPRVEVEVGVGTRPKGDWNRSWSRPFLSVRCVRVLLRLSRPPLSRRGDGT